MTRSVVISGAQFLHMAMRLLKSLEWDSRMRRRKWAQRSIAVLALLVLGVTASVSIFQPVMAAYVCPSCYGFEHIDQGVYVERSMPEADRAHVANLVTHASSQVAAFFGSYHPKPLLLVCATEQCNRRLGGSETGAKAVSFGSRIVRLSPRGLNATLLIHELAHLELHHRIGGWRLLTGAMPAWFDEGLAVIVSKDERYLDSRADGRAVCKPPTTGRLPTSNREWRLAAGKGSTPLYAQAACKVLHWLEANGGRRGLLEAIGEVAEGRRNLP